MLDYVGKRIKIIFDDGNKIVTKFGKLQSNDQNFLVFRSELGEEVVPINRIIRLEVLE